jgi:acetyl esterase/lipase
MAEAPPPRSSADPWPVRTVAYGSHPEQFGQLLVPDAGSKPVPVVVLLHGGFWLSQWKLDLMGPLAANLAQRGWASWNLEYRRADRHGWNATTADVQAGVRYLASLAATFPLNLSEVVLVGHSAGGQLAVRVAADLLGSQSPVRPAVVVSLGGVLDLVEADRRNLGDGAVAAALGGSPAELPETYAASSPILRMPLRIRQIIVTARDDSADLNDLSRRHVAAARAEGDTVIVIEGDGDHFTLIDPGSQVWTDTMGEVLTGLTRPQAL